jgi:hypothetical protein
MFSYTHEGTRTRFEDHCITVLFGSGELSSLWQLTSFRLPGDLNKERRRDILNYGLVFIKAELFPAQLWRPALIHSNERNWR